MRIDKQIANVRFALLQDKKERLERLKLATAVIQNGFIYATDAHVLIKSSIANFMDKKEYIDGKVQLNHSLDGLLLSYDNLTAISKAKKVEFINNQLLLDGKELVTGRHNGKTYIGWIDSDIDGNKIEPNLLPFESVIPKTFGYSYANIGINYESLNRLGKCFKQTSKLANCGLHLEFTENGDLNKDKSFTTRGIKVTNVVNKDLYNEFGMIMPIILELN